MIIKGRRDPHDGDEEPRAQPTPVVFTRTSALIKARDGGPQQPVAPTSPVRRSSVLKRGSYSLAPEDEAPREERPVGPLGPVQVGGGVFPPVGGADMAVSGPAAEVARPEPMAPQGPPVDQQIIEEARRKADAIVRQAQMEAKKLLEQSNVYAQQAMAQAQQQGFEKGKEEGFKAGKVEVAEVIREARSVLSQVVRGRELAVRSSQGEIARLAMKIAAKVTATAVEMDPKIVENQVSEALLRVKEREHISVHVNVADLDTARASRASFERLLESPKSFEIVSDNKVDRGGCIIETNLGNVDARIEAQLGTLQMAFDEMERQQRDEWAVAAEAAGRAALESGGEPAEGGGA